MVVADIAPEKLLNRHLQRFDAFLNDRAPDLEAEEELFWIQRRIARRADHLRAALAEGTDRDLWLAAQQQVLGFSG